MEMGLVIAVSPTAELDRLGDEIAELAAHLDAATARLLALVREFDARGGWNQGFRSCADWLAWRVGLALGAAREKVRVARALGELPLLAEALARGEVSYSRAAPGRPPSRPRPRRPGARGWRGGAPLPGPRRGDPPAASPGRCAPHGQPCPRGRP
jgi:hypothetical protein